MGIDATAYCTNLPKRFLRRLSGPDVLKKLAHFASDWAERQGLGPLFSGEFKTDGSLEIQLVPVADPVIFTGTRDAVAVSFRSSNCGPGFHAAVIDLIENLAMELGIKWSWTGADGTVLDETGFAVLRSFADLQSSMARFLGAMTRDVATATDLDAVSLCLPSGLGNVDGQVACPLGFKPKDWLEQVAAASEETLLAYAADFFPWWNKGLGPEPLAGLLRAQLWQNAEWRIPVSEADHLVNRQIAHTRQWLDKFDLPLAPDLKTALRDHDYQISSETPPATHGIGYRKGLLHEQIFRSWSICRPAYAYAVENGDSAAWEHPGFWLGASSITIRLKPGAEQKANNPEAAEGKRIQLRPGVAYQLKPLVKDQDGHSVQHAEVFSEREGEVQLLILTLSSQVDWPFAELETWLRTVSCPDFPADLAISNQPHAAIYN